jgi:predicted SAM-dependent methyltransferase
MSISTVYWAPNHVRAWRKSVYDSLGGHDPTLKICDDHDLVCRTYLATKLHHIPKPLYLYRVSGRNTWLANQSEISGTTLMLRDKYLERLVLRDCQLRGLKALDLGSERGQRRPGWTTVDIEASPDVDVVADLTLSWPFETGSIGAIRAHDFIEHLPDKMHTMSEVWRCLRPGGWFLSMTPSTDGRGAFQDPTHVSYWNSNAFWYWTRPEQASFIRNDRKLFKEIFLGEVFPSAWHQQHKIPYVRADLLALKQGFEDAGHWPIPPESSSMLGKWDGWYSNLKKTPSAYRYGDTITYRLAANFMQDCTSIEDWGCGAGGLRRFCDPESYVGVDGSQNPHVDVVDDLRTRRSKPQGIVLRHVLEHNYDWRSVLTSAMASATEKVCVVLFTGFVDQTREIDHNRHAGVDAPTLAFSKADIEAFFTGCEFELLENLKTGAGYGVESVYYVWKKGRPRNLSGRKRAVYTAICGDYDLPKKVPVIEGVDFVLFTDREIEAEGWIAKHIPRTSGDPRMIAKQYKLLPHQYLSDYDETVWIDGSFEPTERLAEAFEYLAECPVAFFLHPDRWCIYDEVEASIKMSKYDAEQLRKQAAQYRQTGHPEKFGLYAGGVIARDNRSKTAMELNERWLRECETGSPQDQISLPVVLRSLGLSPFAFRGALWDNTWGSWKSHV